MKKILLTLALGLFVVLAFNSCTKKEDPKPDCELNSYGSVEIMNSTGFDMWVDVTWGNIVENDERKVYKNRSTTYHKTPAGTIEIWGAFDRNDWVYETHSLSVCDEMYFTWTLQMNKSTTEYNTLELLDQDGNVVITTTVKNKNKN